MTWQDSMLWNIRPDCAAEARATLEQLGELQVGADGLHRDNIFRKATQAWARAFQLDELPIDYLNDGRIAIVSVVGALVNLVNPLTANYPALTAAFQRLETEGRVEAVLVRFRSPGGTVSGLMDCSGALDRLSEQKLTVAQVDGGCFSAAYYLAAQCGTIACGRADHVGSIGTILTLEGWSEAYAQAGIRRVTKRTGQLKAIGILGDPVTSPQEQFLQALVDQHFAHFRESVTNGRGFTAEEFTAVASGAFWLGETAVELGLIDRVSSIDETLAAIREQIG